MSKLIGILGGSFNPIHYGHLNIANDLQQLFNFDKVIFMPCGNPVFKKNNLTSNNHRLNMLNLALKDKNNFVVDERELNRKSKSYSIISLEELQQEYPATSLVWIMGLDAFNHFQKWYRYRDILNIANLVVISRPDSVNLANQLLASHLTHNPNDILSIPAGKIYFFPHSNYPYSSSSIRNALKHNQVPNGLPIDVLDYIHNNNCYQFT